MSDDEDGPKEYSEMQWEFAREKALLFGMFKGVKMEEVVRTKRGRDYLRWLLKWDQLSPFASAMITCTMKHYAQLVDKANADNASN